MAILSGNLTKQAKQNPERKGWFMGHFIEHNPPFNTSELELKWGIHKKGDGKPKPGANLTAKSISILIKGRFRVNFPEHNKEIILAKKGDYVYWDPGVKHTSEALTDSIILTIRWPSLPDDHIISE